MTNKMRDIVRAIGKQLFPEELEKSAALPKLPSVETKKVQHPGSKGGKGYYDEKGNWQYGEKPLLETKKPEEASILVGLPEIGTSFTYFSTNTHFIVKDISKGGKIQIIRLKKDGNSIDGSFDMSLKQWNSAIQAGTITLDDKSQDVAASSADDNEKAEEETPSSDEEIVANNIAYLPKKGEVWTYQDDDHKYVVTAVNPDGSGNIQLKQVGKNWPVSYSEADWIKLAKKGKWTKENVPVPDPLPETKEPQEEAKENTSGLPKVGELYKYGHSIDPYTVISVSAHGVQVKDHKGTPIPAYGLKEWKDMVADGSWNKADDSTVPPAEEWTMPEVGETYKNSLSNKIGTITKVEGPFIHLQVGTGDVDILFSHKEWNDFTKDGTWVKQDVVTTQSLSDAEGLPKAGTVWKNSNNGSVYVVKEANPYDGITVVKKSDGNSVHWGTGEWEQSIKDKIWVPFVEEPVDTTDHFTKYKVGDKFVESNTEEEPNPKIYTITGWNSFDGAFNMTDDSDGHEITMSDQDLSWGYYYKPIGAGEFKIGDSFSSKSGKTIILTGYARGEFSTIIDGDTTQSFTPEKIKEAISNGIWSKDAISLEVPVEEKRSYYGYAQPKIGDVFHSQEGYTYTVKSITKKTITLEGDYGKGKKYTPEQWQYEAGVLLRDVPLSNFDREFNPPLPSPYEEKSVSAKKRVCAKLYEDLYTNKAFWDAAQKVYIPSDSVQWDKAGVNPEQVIANPKLAARAKVYLLVTKLVNQWAVTSADTTGTSQALQRAVKDEFNLQDPWDALSSADWSRYGYNEEDKKKGKEKFLKQLEEEYGTYGGAYRAFVRSQYNQTQEFLKAHGKKSLMLYRGVANSKFPATLSVDTDEKGTSHQYGNVKLQPQSSFTTHVAKALEFGSAYTGLVYKKEFPAERIISTALSGVGCLEEHEVTVLGGPPEKMEAFASKDYGPFGGYYSDKKPITEIGSSSTIIWKSENQGNTVDYVDRTIEGADWIKKTPDLGHGRTLKENLQTLGVSDSHFATLPSGKAYARSVAKSVEVKHPGSKGGKGYYNDKGHWVYGKKPVKSTTKVKTWASNEAPKVIPHVDFPAVNSILMNTVTGNRYIVNSIEDGVMHWNEELSNVPSGFVNQTQWDKYMAIKRYQVVGMKQKEIEPQQTSTAGSVKVGDIYADKDNPDSTFQITEINGYGLITYKNLLNGWSYQISKDDWALSMGNLVKKLEGSGVSVQVGEDASPATTDDMPFKVGDRYKDDEGRIFAISHIDSEDENKVTWYNEETGMEDEAYPNSFKSTMEEYHWKKIEPEWGHPVVTTFDKDDVYHDIDAHSYYKIVGVDGNLVEVVDTNENGFPMVKKTQKISKDSLAASIKDKSLIFMGNMPNSDRVEPIVGTHYLDKNQQAELVITSFDDKNVHYDEVTEGEDGQNVAHRSVSMESFSNWGRVGIVRIDPNAPKAPSVPKAGDLYWDKSADNWYAIIGLNEKTKLISYVYGYDKSTLYSRGEVNHMTLTEWRKRRNFMEFKESNPVKPIPEGAYKPGDEITYKDYGTTMTAVIYKVTPEKVFYYDEDNDGEVSYQRKDRDSFDFSLQHGGIKLITPNVYPTGEKDKIPPISKEEYGYRIPNIGDRFHGEGNYGLGYIYWNVQKVDKDNITLVPEQETSGLGYYNPVVIPTKTWREGANNYVRDAIAIFDAGNDYHPPMVQDIDDDSAAAKKRVCAALYNRLATNPDFYHFAQRFPNITSRDNGDAGLPEDAYLLPDTPRIKQAKVYLAVRRLVHLWAITSADTQPKAQCMQRAVADEFGLKGYYDPMKSVEGERIDIDGKVGKDAFSELVDAEYKKNSPAYRAFVRAQYDETQEFLKKKGLKELTLYRGVANSSGYIQIPSVKETDEYNLSGYMNEEEYLAKHNQGTPIPVILQPQSSFTTYPPKAFDFAGDMSGGIVFKEKIPAERIISTALSGVGCREEREVTVLGGPPEKMYAYRKDDYIGNVSAMASSEEDLQDKTRDIWKSMTKKMNPVALDAVLSDADWTKGTPDIPLKELSSTLKALGITREQFLALPSGKAYVRAMKKKKK